MDRGPRWQETTLLSSSPKKGKAVTCSGQACRIKTKPNAGNKACSNGTLCNGCCKKHQESHDSPCNYSSHNYRANNGAPSTPTSRGVRVTDDTDPFLLRSTNEATTISPYHQRAVYSYKHITKESLPTKKVLQFQVAWHSKVC